MPRGAAARSGSRRSRAAGKGRAPPLAQPGPRGAGGRPAASARARSVDATGRRHATRDVSAPGARPRRPRVATAEAAEAAPVQAVAAAIQSASGSERRAPPSAGPRAASAASTAPEIAAGSRWVSRAMEAAAAIVKGASPGRRPAAQRATGRARVSGLPRPRCPRRPGTRARRMADRARGETRQVEPAGGRDGLDDAAAERGRAVRRGPVSSRGRRGPTERARRGGWLAASARRAAITASDLRVGLRPRARVVDDEMAEALLLVRRHLGVEARARRGLGEAVARHQAAELLLGLAVHDHQAVEAEVLPVSTSSAASVTGTASVRRQRSRLAAPPPRAPADGRGRRAAAARRGVREDERAPGPCGRWRRPRPGCRGRRRPPRRRRRPRRAPSARAPPRPGRGTCRPRAASRRDTCDFPRRSRREPDPQHQRRRARRA